MALANWVFYVACYTPLKARTVWQLPVGAVAGAMPMLIGGAVAGAPLNALSLDAVRNRVLLAVPARDRDCLDLPSPVCPCRIAGRLGRRPVRTTGRDSGRAGAAILLPVSVLPVVLHQALAWFGVVAMVCGLAYLFLAVRFWRERSDRRARHMLWASFLYLPIVLVASCSAPSL